MAKKNYLGLVEVIDSSMWTVSNDIEQIKKNWHFSLRIFEVPLDFTIKSLNNYPKPRYKQIAEAFPLIYKEGELIHEEELEKHKS